MIYHANVYPSKAVRQYWYGLITLVKQGYQSIKKMVVFIEKNFSDPNKSTGPWILEKS